MDTAIDRAVAAHEYLRQLDWLDPTKVTQQVHIVGAGGIGSFTALALGKLGIRNLHVYDFDKVEAHNQPNQLYGRGDVGSDKLMALEEIVLDLTGQTINRHEGRFATTVDGLLISGVDSMKSRREIWDYVKASPHCQRYFDGRIGGEQVRLYTVNPQSLDERKIYEETLYDDSAVEPLPCTRQSVIDIGFFVGAMITRAVRQYLATGVSSFEVILDVANMAIYKRGPFVYAKPAKAVAVEAPVVVPDEPLEEGYEDYPPEEES